MPWNQTHTPKNRNADDSGSRLRNVVWASRPQELKNMKVSRPTWFPMDSAGGGLTNRNEREGAILLWIQQGGVYGHSVTKRWKRASK